MTDTINPVTDTWKAIKARMAGPFGTFILVWAIKHPKVIAFFIFDAAGKSEISQADAKIQKITEILSSESYCELFVGPIFWTIVLMLSLQVLSLIWHYISERFLFWQERFTAQKNFKINIYQRFGNQSEDFVKHLKEELTTIAKSLKESSNLIQGISAIDADARCQAVERTLIDHARKQEEKLQKLITMLKAANDDPIFSGINLGSKKNQK